MVYPLEAGDSLFTLRLSATHHMVYPLEAGDNLFTLRLSATHHVHHKEAGENL